MQQPLPPVAPVLHAPSFYLTGRQPLRPGAILLATIGVLAALSSVLYALEHTGHISLSRGGNGGSSRTDAATTGSAAAGEEKDDPSQVDTIVLGDPGEAPAPARRGDHVSPVHPTILIHLPRFGDQTGLIPDVPAGRLLYGWLAAFNQANLSGLEQALPSAAGTQAAAVQIELRRLNRGFNLLSAKEAQPGVLVFRLRDQTPEATEVLGTLEMLPNSSPAAIASFSLRAVPSPQPAARGREE